MVDQLALGTGIIILFQSTATGIAVITDSVFTNTSNIQLSVVYK